jgi:hypothetical protein
MKLLFHLLLIVAAIGVGLAIGFALRPKPARPKTVAADVAAKLPGTLKLHPRLPIRDDSPLATKLEHALALSSGVTRWLCWLEALEKAAPSDFPRLARLAKGNPAVLRLVADRWVAVAPRHLFDTLVAASKGVSGLPVSELQAALFDTWPKRDPDAAIAAVNEAGDFSMRRDVADSVLRADVERGLRLMAAWHIDDVGPAMDPIVKWAASSPRHAAEFTLQNAVGRTAQYAAETIGKVWAKTDPAAALAFAAANPGGPGSALGAAALKQWAASDLDAAAQWLAAADAPARNRLSPAFVETWAQKDAASALAWCADNLAGSSLGAAVGGALKGAAEKDEASAAALVTAMEPSPARAEAAAAVARKWFADSASGKPVQPDAVTWLAGLDPDSVKRALKEPTVKWGWSSSDPKSMAAFLTAADPESTPAVIYRILARQMVRERPSEALDWANQLPREPGLDAGSAAFAEWCISQPEAATQWFNALPATDARHQRFLLSAVQSLANQPQAEEQLAALPASDRAAARSVLQDMNMPEARRTQLLNALKPR